MARLATVAISAVLALSAAPPSEDVERRLAGADALFQRSAWEQAAREYESILAESSGAFKTLYQLTICYHELDDETRFEDAMRRLLAVAPERSEPYLLMGRRTQREGRFPDAERAYRRSLDLDPDSVEALSGLAEVSLALGYREDGIAYLRRIVTENPSHVGYLWMLARALDDPEQEREIYRRIVAAAQPGDEVAQGRFNLLEARADLDFFHVVGLEKPEKIRLFYTPGKVSRAQFIAADEVQGPRSLQKRQRRPTPNTPFIRARVNGSTSQDFLLDTGTQGVHISKSLARKLGLESYGTSRVEGLGQGDVIYGDIVFLDSLVLDDIEIRNVPAEAIDLEGIGDGIMNPAVLRGLRVQILNSRRQLVLSHWPEPGEPDPLAPHADSRRAAPVTLPFLSFQGHIVIRIEILGMPGNALLDTGAESTFLDLGVLAALPALESHAVGGYGVALEGISGQVLDARVVREAQINLASENLRVVNLFAADLRRLGDFYGPEIHAILGMRELRGFDVTFDFRRHEVTFQRILR